MDGGDVKIFVKHNWPYILGGVVGLWLIMRYSGGSSAPAQNSSGDEQQFMALMNAQAAQSAAQGAQVAMANKNLDQQYAIAVKSLEVQNAQGNNATQVAWLQAQGDAAMKTAGASAMLVDALNRPASQAIASSGQVTAAGLAASGMVGVAGFQAQAQTVTAAANVLNTNTMAQTSIINQSMVRDMAIAKTNAGVASDALKYNSQVMQGYYGAYADIAGSFMSQGTAPNVMIAPPNATPQMAGQVQSSNWAQVASTVAGGINNWGGGYSTPQVTNNPAYGNNTVGNTGYTLPNGGNSALGTIYGNAGYGEWG